MYSYNFINFPTLSPILQNTFRELIRRHQFLLPLQLLERVRVRTILYSFPFSPASRRGQGWCRLTIAEEYKYIGSGAKLYSTAKLVFSFFSFLRRSLDKPLVARWFVSEYMSLSPLEACRSRAYYLAVA